MLISILVAAFLAILCVLWVVWKIDQERFLSVSRLQLGLTAGSFWLLFSIGLTVFYWKSYYEYFVPRSLLWLRPLSFVIYFLAAVGMRWLALRLPGHPSLTFCLLGGLESIPEHALGIYRMHILEIPLLQGTRPHEIFIFAFFEYVIYWAIVLLLAAWLGRLWIKKRRGTNLPTPPQV